MVVDWGSISASAGAPKSGALHGASVIGKSEKAYQQHLDQKLGYAERSLAAAYGQAFAQVEKQMAALAAHMQAEIAKGHYSPSWTMQQDRYKSLLNQYSAAVKQFNKSQLSTVNYVHQAGIQAALNHTPTQVMDYMGGTAPTGVTIPGFDPSTWGTINAKAFSTAVGLMNNQDSPLRSLMAKLGDDTLHAVQTEWAKGMALGYNPKKIAKNIANATANIALGRARTIARTEFHRSYRETKRQQYLDSDVVNGWVWKANLDPGTCGLCVAMGGSRHGKGDILDSHPNCRCSMVPLTKTWADLGFPGVPGDEPAALNVPSGPEWLLKQSDAQIKRTLGKARGEDFIQKTGKASGKPSNALARIVAKSYVHQTQSDMWGPMKQLTPFVKGSKLPAATGPAPVAPAATPTAAPKAKAAPGMVVVGPSYALGPSGATPKAPKASPKAAVAAQAHQAAAQVANKVTGMFSKATKAAKGAQTKLGHDWLNHYNSASAAKGGIAHNLGEMSKAEYNKALKDWDGEWADYRTGGLSMVPSSGQYYSSTTGMRYQLPKPWATMTPAEREAFLASPSGEALREDLAARMVQTWASTSADNNPLSLLAQQRAEAIFGMSADTTHLQSSTGWQAASKAPPPMVAIMDSTLRSMYAHTQAEFAREGITHIRLIRGQGWSQGRPAWVDNLGPGESAQGMTMLQPMSSFSSSKAIATRFAVGYPSYYISSDFPVEWIIGSARTGFGCLNEQEFVVAGGAPIHCTVTRRH